MEHESSKNFDIYVLPTSHNIWKQLIAVQMIEFRISVFITPPTNMRW